MAISVLPLRKRGRLVGFRYEPRCDALYIRLREGQVHKTSRLAEGAYLDLDIAGRVFESSCSLEESAFCQGRAGVEPPGCLEGTGSLRLNLDQPLRLLGVRSGGYCTQEVNRIAVTG